VVKINTWSTSFLFKGVYILDRYAYSTLKLCFAFKPSFVSFKILRCCKAVQRTCSLLPLQLTRTVSPPLTSSVSSQAGILKPAVLPGLWFFPFRSCFYSCSSPGRASSTRRVVYRTLRVWYAALPIFPFYAYFF
jgi:hypothetical protein